MDCCVFNQLAFPGEKSFRFLSFSLGHYDRDDSDDDVTAGVSGAQQSKK